ncbi:hypothetical protein evm_004615 [Chilo suppressalis]|nr:hypothetical protein evm_004615 [Chilo suppressalis]
MKKYLKSKFEEDMNMNSSSMGDEKYVKEINNKVNTGVLQPPLPPNSPPPDSTLTKVKQEVVDDEYEKTTDETVKESEPMIVKDNTHKIDCKNQKMCRDFVRNECIRGASCMYAHEIDFSQLEGVYKFCRDFENESCNRPVCHFVHATTFEKEHFFRTAKLPPHTLVHIPKKKKNEGPPEVAPVFLKPPPSLPPSVGVAPMAPPAPPCPAPLKRKWRDTEDFTSQLHKSEGKEPLAKKCKRCELTELRLQHIRAQVAQTMRSSREMDEKIELINKRNNRLHEVLRVLLKPRRSLEHVNTNFLGASRLSAAPLAEDNNKEALLAQVKMLLTKIVFGGDVSSVEGATTGS